MVQVVTKDIVRAISAGIGESKVDDSKATRIAHRIGHGVEVFLHDNFDHFTPGVVVWPESVEDIQKILRIASEWEVPVVPQGGRTSSYGAEGMHGCIVLDPGRMDRIVEFDEVRRRVTAEAGIRVADLADYVTSRGYMLLELPSMEKVSYLGSRAALHGYNRFENRWGSSGYNIKGLEVVLASGDVVRLGKGSRVPAKNVVGYDLMDIFIGSQGTLGIITKVTERIIDIPKVTKYGIMAFKSYQDGLGAYVDIKRANEHIGPVWRVKSYNKWELAVLVKSEMGRDWPEDVEQVTDYQIVGEEGVVAATEKRVLEICQAHNGFWREDLPPRGFVGRVMGTHGKMEKYMALGAIGTARLRNGGMGARFLLLDAAVPDGNYVELYGNMLELYRKLGNKNIYPNLAKNIIVLNPGAPIPADDGFSKNWAGLLSNTRIWDPPTREEFLRWFREYAETIWRFGGSLTNTHGFIPRELEVEFIKREVGEKEYELMGRIKDLFDPKHILNPKVKFRY